MERSCASAAQTRIPGSRVKHSCAEPLRFSIFITTVHLHMVGRSSMCAFIIYVTEYERLKIKIPVERSFEVYLNFIPPFCLIFFFNLILVYYSPEYDDVQNP